MNLLAENTHTCVNEIYMWSNMVGCLIKTRPVSVCGWGGGGGGGTQ